MHMNFNFNGFSAPVHFAYDFTTPQIVNKYRIWGRFEGNTGSGDQNPKTWEFRGAVDKATYDAGGSGAYEVLDTQSNQVFNSWSGNYVASENLNLALKIKVVLVASNF